MEEYIRTKSAGDAAGLTITDEDLALINSYTLRAFKAEELFAFRVTLCDNEVDRDFERFPTVSLHKLAELFLGKTGVFDHNPSASNQTARVYHTEIVTEEGKQTSLGEPYTRLAAKAYMIRDASTDGVIRSIEAGIRKEVSVGCAVGKITCSVCGKDRRGDGCPHRKGRIYDGGACHHLLEEPTDAYEWSFVAVPAQPAAGVMKSKEDVLLAAIEALISAVQSLTDRLAVMTERGAPPEKPLDEHKAAPGDEEADDLIKSVNKLIQETERSMGK